MLKERKSLQKERMDLDIFFRRTLPENVLEYVKNISGWSQCNKELVNAYTYPEDMYRYFSRLSYDNLSREEIYNRYRILFNAPNGITSIFELLPRYANEVLDIRDGVPICKTERILSWNEASNLLGQDIFVTAWYAKRFSERYMDNRHPLTFTWKAIIRADEPKIQSLFEKGMAENHFHLHGATQSFALSWACMMNFPDTIEQYFKHNFGKDLNINMQPIYGLDMLSWPDRIKYAAWIRANLFQLCIELDEKDVMSELSRDTNIADYHIGDSVQSICKMTEALRYQYGYKFKQPGGCYRCLDYANAPVLYRVDANSPVRLLAGERNFMYQCFKNIFKGRFSHIQGNYFYAYLLIKSGFRGEMIQNNGVVGFANFKEYQDRKNQFFERRMEYWTESLRLSVAMALDEGHIYSLEGRIMPKKSARELKYNIYDTDMRIKEALNNQEDLNNFFYVIHFPKVPFDGKEYRELSYEVPRNYKIRIKSKQFAIALGQYIENENPLKQRVYGIDACSTEIGCRPEVFATEFRYIRRCSSRKAEECEVEKFLTERTEWKQHKEYGITYHVGEDFLDIVDGLRAIDEAIMFLEMRKGDRLGHAIALGIDPEYYYKMKHYEVFLTKQDILDNLVWILYRSQELGISIVPNLRIELEAVARKLLYEIYACNTERRISLDDYYDSWKLRGDNPNLYESGHYEAHKRSFVDNLYDECKILSEEKLELYRNNVNACFLFYMYHFNPRVKDIGLENERFDITLDIVQMVKQIQRHMQLYVNQKGIAIECNPTSNLRISVINSYDKHPIFNLNSEYLEEECTNMHMFVSINTDDIGVFDTSLENEYMVMYDAICRKRHEAGNYDDYQVIKYLDHIRQNGLEMSFKKMS